MDKNGETDWPVGTDNQGKVIVTGGTRKHLIQDNRFTAHAPQNCSIIHSLFYLLRHFPNVWFTEIMNGAQSM